MPTILLHTRIAASPERCFDLSRDVSVHTGSATGERAVAGVTIGQLGPNDEVTFEAKHLALRWRMTSKIVAFDRPHRFVDEMQSGPFKRWRHEHRFEPDGAGTAMADRVEYEPLLWPLSWPVDVLFLRRYMTRLLRRRNEHLRDRAEDRLSRSAPGSDPRRPRR